MIDKPWPIAGAAPSLAAHQLHLCCARTGSVPIAWESYLSEEERQRGRRFVNAAARTRFLAGRMMLRKLLAGYLGAAPAALEFAYGENGKPRLRGDTTLSFSMSHSGGIVLVGVCRGMELGVDVEEIRAGIDIAALARNCFGPRERQAFAAMPAAAQTTAFYTFWVRKEAYLKMRGTGLVDRLCDIDLQPVHGSHAAIVEIAGRRQEQSTFLFEARPDRSHVAAAMAAGEGLEVVLWTRERLSAASDCATNRKAVMLGRKK